MKIAILMIYQNVALSIADWSAVASRRADMVGLYNDLYRPNRRIDRKALCRSIAICVMRERTPLSRYIIECLPRLEVHCFLTGPRNISIDMDAANERGHYSHPLRATDRRQQ